MSAPSLPGGAVLPGAARVSHALAALALALLMGLQPITTDVYLPALPALTRDLHAPMSAVQLTMSALFLAFGFAQLIWGPVADRIGRRPVLLIGLALYTAASIGCALAATIGWLIAWRAVQGACMAAAVVCARAMLRDLYEPHDAARVLALALSGLAVIAIVGPVLGGVVAAAFNWRAALALVAVCGALTLAFVAWKVPETAAQSDPQATRFAPLMASWGRIARHPTFVAWTLLVSCTFGGMFTILAGSAFVYMDVLGMSAAGYGMAMASSSLSYLFSTLLCRRWIARHGMAGTVQRGALFTLAGGLSMLVLALAGVHSVWAVLVPQWFYAFGHGQHQPCGQAAAVGPFPQAAGAASALTGFVLAITAFGVGLWLGRALDGSVLPLALGVCFWSLLTSVVAWTLVPRAQRLGAHPA